MITDVAFVNTFQIPALDHTVAPQADIDNQALIIDCKNSASDDITPLRFFT